MHSKQCKYQRKIRVAALMTKQQHECVPLFKWGAMQGQQKMENSIAQCHYSPSPEIR